MLANRPRGISINKNTANVQLNNIANAGLKDNVTNLKRSLFREPQEVPLKAPSSKTPSPPKLKSQFNNLRQTENEGPMLIDLSEEPQDDLVKPQQAKTQTNKQPILSQIEPLARSQPSQNESKQNEPQATVQSVISRIPRLREVGEEIEDIDKSNSKSRDAIFQVCDVAKDIYSYLFQLEEAQSIPEDFLKEQTIFVPRVRQRLVNWCVDLASKINLLTETLYMTISIIDRYFASVVIKHQSHVQLVALGAILVAAKYEEIYPPDMNDLIEYSENLYSRRDILRMEIDILHKLNFDLGRPIPQAFLRRFSRVAQCDLKMHSIAKFLMEISLSEYECAHWKPSLLAAAALFTTIHLVHNQQTSSSRVSESISKLRSTRLSSALTSSGAISSFGLTRRLVSGPPVVQDRWNKALVHYTGYTRKDLRVPAAILCKILKKVLKPPQSPTVKNHLSSLSKWPELKSTRVDELIRLGEGAK